MRARIEEDASVPSHRWILSWSDFVTLLLVVFAAMYAQTSQVPPSCETPSQPTLSTDHSAPLASLSAELKEALSTADSAGFHAKLMPMTEGLLLELEARLLFASGDARLTPKLQAALEAIAPVLVRHDYPVVIEGYADTTPISNRHYPSNWELSAARAASVARLFVLEGMNEEHIEVTGRGTNLAVTDNATPAARQANRRVRILVRVPGTASASLTAG